MHSHLLLMTLFAFFVSLVFAVIAKDDVREQARFGGLMFAGFLIVAFVVGWLMYPFPHAGQWRVSAELAPTMIVTIQRDEPIAVITLNRPDVLNAINSAMLDELEGALVGFRSDDGVRVVILTGAGKAFA